jgi:hypothetical protein
MITGNHFTLLVAVLPLVSSIVTGRPRLEFKLLVFDVQVVYTLVSELRSQKFSGHLLHARS